MSEAGSYVVSAASTAGRGVSVCNGPGAEVDFGCLKNHTAASVQMQQQRESDNQVEGHGRREHRDWVGERENEFGRGCRAPKGTSVLTFCG